MENEIEDWESALRRMRVEGEFDDKFLPTNLTFVYAFQMGYKAALSKSQENDPMPTEDDFYTGAADASGEVYDQFLSQEYEHALNEWKKRQAALSKGGQDIYSGDLNRQRIKAYQKLAEEYNVDEGTVRDIFCKGADWGISLSKGGWTDEDLKESLRVGVNIGMQNAKPDEWIGVRWDIEKMVSECSEYINLLKNEHKAPTIKEGLQSLHDLIRPPKK